MAKYIINIETDCEENEEITDDLCDLFRNLTFKYKEVYGDVIVNGEFIYGCGKGEI
ncbi:hypothetical protein MmiHf6_06200 [Methanimicrococcus hongohii]|uniref:Uncharacterized protein n=1 Tax=Methanimicrococcus hongohii TaxID=3028295 RepID=A0AA96ZSD1_9EURY|nr:hypothetical protein [Methanimicrococcus sp. Hf6]WNY23315.1 hypothetical protein MmiHf6_06200 [Methanimicrococcus sp. Hf6]